MIVWVKEKDSLKLETLKEDHTFLLYDISVTVFPYENFCKLSSYTFTFEKSRVRYGQCIAFMDSVHELQGRIIIEKDDMEYGCYERINEITVGSQSSDSITLSDNFGSLRIFGDQFQGFHHLLDITHNGISSNSGTLLPGDELLFYPLVFRFEKDIVFVRKVKNAEIHLNPYTKEGSASVMEVRKEKEAFYGYEPHIERNLIIQIQPMETVKEMNSTSLLQILPSAFMASAMLAVSLMNSLRYGRKETTEMISALLLPVTMLVSALVFPLLMRILDKRKYRKEEDKARSKFRNRLERYQKEIEQFEKKYQQEISFLIDEEREVIQNTTNLYVITGNSEETLQVTLEKNWEGDEKTESVYQSFVKGYRKKKLPFACNLFSYSQTVITGSKRREYAKNLIYAIVHNSTVPLLFYVDDKDDSLFYLRDIPNTFHKGIRCITGNEEKMESFIERNERCVVFCFKAFHSKKKRNRNQIIIHVTEKEDESCDLFLKCEEEIRVQDYLNHESFTMSYPPLKQHTQLRKSELALPFHNTDFLSVHECRETSDLNMTEQYRMNHSTDSLRGILGIDEMGKQIVLDIHESKDGPHGIVAGMTGSGKSELLLSYVLSLCCSYSSKDLQFAFIDFKGGGLATILKNLPHTAGVLSNLDYDCMDRALLSFNRICTEREELLLRMHEKCGQPISNLKDYRSHFDSIYGLPWIADLVIIIDEFAELKKARPDDMKNLISIARIGRSLGIHLILCTQKPSGVINEEILSNCAFRISLKVSSRSDSNEVTGSPAACYFTRPGQFLLKTQKDLTSGSGSYISTSTCQDGYEIESLNPDGSVADHSGKYLPQSESQLLSLLREIEGNCKESAETLWKQPPDQNTFEKYDEDVFLLEDDEVCNRYLEVSAKKEGLFLIVSGREEVRKELLKSVLSSCFSSERKTVFSEKEEPVSNGENMCLVMNGLPFENDEIAKRHDFIQFLKECHKNKNTLFLFVDSTDVISSSITDLFDDRFLFAVKNESVLQKYLPVHHAKGKVSDRYGLTYSSNRLMKLCYRKVDEQQFMKAYEKYATLYPETEEREETYEGKEAVLGQIRGEWITVDSYPKWIVTAAYPNDMYALYQSLKDKCNCYYSDTCDKEGICFMSIEKARTYINQIPVLLTGKEKERQYGFVHEFKNLKEDEAILFFEYHSEVMKCVSTGT